MAIKRIMFSREDSVIHMVAIIREIYILRKFAERKSTKFVAKLLDAFIPDYAVEDLDKFDCVYLVFEFFDYDLHKLMS